MPDLVNTDGTTVAPSLTKEELEVLAENGVEFDIEDESDGDDLADDGEAVPDDDAEDSIEDVPTEDDPEPDSDGEGERDGEADGEAEGEGDGSDESSDGSAGDSRPESDDADSEGEPTDEAGGEGESGSGEAEVDEADPDLADGDGEAGDTTDSSDSEDVDVEDPSEAEITDESGDGESAESPDEVSGEMDDYEHTIEPDDELVDEMDDRGDDDELADKFDVDIEDVHRTDDRDIERWHRLVKSLQEYDTELERRKRERDERIGDVRVDEDSEKIEQRANQSGAISELKDGFRQLVSRPTPRPATAGPQIDPYNVTRRAAGDMTITELFEEHVEVETGDRCVGLATDISGSMRGDMSELKIAGGVIAEATEIIGDDFVWEAFTDQYNRSHTPSEERLDLRIVTGPNESFDWEHVDSFTSSYNEPTAAGVRDCRMLMEQTAARQHVMIVITDGVTLVEEDGTYRGSRSPAPVDHARRAVEECRQDGFEVIGLGIGDMDEEKMEEQFGTDSQGNPNYKLTSIDELAEDILEIYRAQMSVTRR